ncbi:MAG: (2Fe-2S) ferredoxin domain-containing protein [Actinomycetota bacterium]|nr:(2Fe-2S) ferredoxin domain-containing protein [Actinomycetota bacterium]
MTVGPAVAPQSSAEAEATRCVVTVCRGCCCGTASKHPDVDHSGQLEQLRLRLGGATPVRVSDCLDSCEHSNVIVVTPSVLGRRAGTGPVWLGEVLDPDSTAELAEWVAAGGPGVADAPAALSSHVFRPPRQMRLDASPQ